MALEAVAFARDPLTYKDLYTLYGGIICSNESFEYPQIPQHPHFPENQTENFPVLVPNSPLKPESIPTRPRKRRPKSCKNKEQIENQRMTHIAVERNRRKQMNEYLSVLRSLMPDSYIQRGDQASIIAGAINFLKVLEQRVQFLSNSNCSCSVENDTQSSSSIADIEVTMVENHASVKIRSKKRPKQVLKIVAGLHSLSLSVLHLNVSTIDQIALYSLSVKVEDDCKLSSVDEIASALHMLLGRIEQDSLMS